MASHECYVEVFGGGAQLLFAKEPSRVEVYNDIDGRLVNLFKVAKEQGAELQKRLEDMLYSRRLYGEFRHWHKSGDAVEDAARFYYFVRSSYSGEVGTGWRHSVKANEARKFFSMVSQLSLVQHRLRNVQIEMMDFRRCIKTYDSSETLFFCDPPYYGAKRYKFRFNEEDHEDLAEILRSVEGKWLLTYNDHPRIRHLYAGYPLRVVKRTFSSGLVKQPQKRSMWDQLIIANYELPSTPQFLKKSLFPERLKIPGAGPGFKSRRPRVVP
jgi:DNA adenine methylase